jgi:hypothetical protein
LSGRLVRRQFCKRVLFSRLVACRTHLVEFLSKALHAIFLGVVCEFL